MITHIFEDLCNGCNACVSACPTHVLDAADDGTPRIARLDQCQTCYMCELYCESDAIYVGADQHGPEAIDVEQVRASGDLGRLRRDSGWIGKEPVAADLTEFWQLGPLLREGAEIAGRRHASRSAHHGEVPEI